MSALIRPGCTTALLAATVIALSGSIDARAQRRGPDLLGLYPGMPTGEARKVLQAHSDTSRITQNTALPQEFTLGINLQGYYEQVVVNTTDPATPSVVWHVARTISYQADPVATPTMLDALRQKYGKETAMSDRGTAKQLWWLFDSDGRVAASADQRMLTACDGLVNVGLVREGPRSAPGYDLPTCYGSASTVVRVRLVEQRPDILSNAEITLLSVPIGYQAALAVQKGRQNEAERQRQEELERARQKRPKL